MSGSATVGWCPGALRPMESGDGLILRVKPRGGRLGLDQAEAIAGLSRRFGNGHLDLTGRANLQIRGARADTLDALTEGLREAGLLDGSAAVESLRNVVASPLAGLDRDGFDIRPFLVTLEHGLAAEPRLVWLPPKWSFVVDGGGCLPLDGIPGDVRFRFEPDGRLRIGCGARWSEPLASPLDLPRFLDNLARLVAAQPKPMRMAALLGTLGVDEVFARLGLVSAAAPVALTDPVRAADLFALPAGVVGFAPAFGALPASTLAGVTEACRAAGVSELRLTPWRVMLATGAADPASLRHRLDRLNLVLRADDPRLDITACVGAPACHRASTATRVDAALLAARPGRDPGWRVHVAGCAKGCGRPSDAATTLVAREGLYDLFDGIDGVPRAAGLSFTEAANWLSRAEPARMA